MKVSCVFTKVIKYFFKVNVCFNKKKAVFIIFSECKIYY